MFVTHDIELLAVNEKMNDDAMIIIIDERVRIMMSSVSSVTLSLFLSVSNINNWLTTEEKWNSLSDHFHKHN